MNKARLSIVLVLVLAIGVAGIARQWAMSLQERARPNAFATGTPANGPRHAAASFSGMDSYALALLLGGLRGPLVMFLWTSSETQKSAHDLTDFDTKVEWIRLLQPEFDVVHMFQIWNKAYNVSAQMSSLPNKYVTILDAIEYARSVDRDRPDDINMVSEIGSLFADKLGNSQEKDYYSRRVRVESMAASATTLVHVPQAEYDAFLAAAHDAGLDAPMQEPSIDLGTNTVRVVLPSALAEKLKPRFEPLKVTFAPLPVAIYSAVNGAKPTRLEPMLDAAGNVLPSLLIPTHEAKPANLDADANWYDGSEMEFLTRFGPYPYGLSPQAIGFNYFKRAQMLQRVGKQQHLQQSEFIVDSRPGMALKTWAADEAFEGRQAELRLFGIDDSGTFETMHTRAPGADPDVVNKLLISGGSNIADQWKTIRNAQAGARALYQYQRASDLYRSAQDEMNRHIVLYPSSRVTYSSHLDDEAGYEKMLQADHDFLQGVLDPSKAAASWTSATQHYIDARQAFELCVLKYYTEDSVAQQTFPIDPNTHRPMNHQNIDQLPPEARDRIYPVMMTATQRYVADVNNYDNHKDERTLENEYIRRCQARIAAMQLARSAPTMSGASN